MIFHELSLFIADIIQEISRSVLVWINGVWELLVILPPLDLRSVLSGVHLILADEGRWFPSLGSQSFRRLHNDCFVWRTELNINQLWSIECYVRNQVSVMSTHWAHPARRWLWFCHSWPCTCTGRCHSGKRYWSEESHQITESSWDCRSENPRTPPPCKNTAFIWAFSDSCHAQHLKTGNWEKSTIVIFCP